MKRHLAVRLGALVFVSIGSAIVASEARADDLSYKVDGEVSAYKDSEAVNVLTPGVHAEVDGVTGGWSVGAGFLVDVVTAASTDIVSTASPKWTDVRYVPSAEGSFHVSEDVTMNLAGGASIESDYWAGNGSVGMSVDLADKTITPSFVYGFSYGIGGRRGTPLSVYHLDLATHSFDAAVSFVVNRATIFVPSFSAIFEHGDQEKPYRYVPTFSAADAETLDAGASVEEVDQKRTSVRLEENTPRDRERFAASFLVAHRFGDTTLRVSERLYGDTWMLLASTTDFMLPIDVGDVVRVWPHVRFHVQKGVAFWQRAYVLDGALTGSDDYAAPDLRTGDRELGPLLSPTVGAGIRLGEDGYGFTFEAEAIYTRFLDDLYITDRIAGLGSIGFDLQVD